MHLNPLDILLESQQPDRPPPDFRWGVVNGTSPDLSVRLDRDPTTVIGSCCSLSYPLQAGDRVMVMIYDGRAVVFGRGAGDRWSPVENWEYTVPSANAGWVTVAKIGSGGRSDATFRIFNYDSGDHDLLTLRVKVAHGHASIVLDSYMCFVPETTPGILGARYLPSSSDPTYGDGILQVNLGETLTNWTVVCEQMDLTVLNRPWIPMNFSTSTTGYSLTPRDQIGVAPTFQRPMPLVNGWENYGGGFAEPTMAMGPGSMVSLTGLIKRGTSASSNIMAILPPGWRPKEALIIPTVVSYSGHSLGRIDISPAGELKMSDPVWSSVGWASVPAVSYRAYH